MTTLRLTYYPDITQDVPDAHVRDAVVEFSEALAIQLSTQLGSAVKVEVPSVMEVPDQFRDLLSGNSHIALMKPVAYVFAHNANPEIVPACVAHRPIDGAVGTFYFTQIYARAELGVHSLKDLRDYGSGKLRIAYGDRFSTSNFLISASLLRKNRIHPFLHFRSISFEGGHDLAAKAVYEGRADVGAGHDGVIKILAKSFPDAEDTLVQVGRENIHSDPVVVHTGILPSGVTLAAIQDACSVVAKTPVGQRTLDLFWGWVKDLSPTRHENYDSIEAAITNLGLNVSDMLS